MYKHCKKKYAGFIPFVSIEFQLPVSTGAGTCRYFYLTLRKFFKFGRNYGFSKSAHEQMSCNRPDSKMSRNATLLVPIYKFFYRQFSRYGTVLYHTVLVPVSSIHFDFQGDLEKLSKLSGKLPYPSYDIVLIPLPTLRLPLKSRYWCLAQGTICNNHNSIFIILVPILHGKVFKFFYVLELHIH